jgi:hypothetical protein
MIIDHMEIIEKHSQIIANELNTTNIQKNLNCTPKMLCGADLLFVLSDSVLPGFSTLFAKFSSTTTDDSCNKPNTILSAAQLAVGHRRL